MQLNFYSINSNDGSWRSIHSFYCLCSWEKERKRIGVAEIQYKEEFQISPELAASIEDGVEDIKRPNLIWVNFFLTMAVMATLVLDIVPIPVLFLIGFVIALMINYPKVEDQRERILSHAGNALTVITLVFAAGIFTGIFQGQKWWSLLLTWSST